MAISGLFPPVSTQGQGLQSLTLGEPSSQSSGFGNVLKNALNQVTDLQGSADQQVSSLLSGGNADMSKVMISVESDVASNNVKVYSFTSLSTTYPRVPVAFNSTATLFPIGLPANLTAAIAVTTPSYVYLHGGLAGSPSQFTTYHFVTSGNGSFDYVSGPVPEPWATAVTAGSRWYNVSDSGAMEIFLYDGSANVAQVNLTMNVRREVLRCHRKSP